MPLSNADRQRRFCERHPLHAPGAVALTPEQRADRDAVVSEPIWPVPAGTARDQMPTFMGRSRYDRSVAPEPPIDVSGVRETPARRRLNASPAHHWLHEVSRYSNPSRGLSLMTLSLVT